MKKKASALQLTLQERHNLALPATLVGFLLAIGLISQSFSPSLSEYQQDINLCIGLISAVYIVLLFTLILPLLERFPVLNWIVVVFNAISLGCIGILGPFEPPSITLMLSLIAVTVTAIISGRWPTYLFILINVLFQIGVGYNNQAELNSSSVTQVLTVPLLGVIITETILRLVSIIHRQLNRLETLNGVARSLASSLETHQVVTLLNSAIQNAFQADTFYIGLIQNNKLRLELFYDEGEFFPQTEVPLDNSLAGWVLRRRRSLLIRNLKREVRKLGITPSVAGKPKPSKSWMGTPIESGGRLLGLVAVASYQGNAFHQPDLELLENIAQQAAMAIDNCFHHAEVEKQSRLDSLTGVYNHGYFLKILSREAEAAQREKRQFSLIMLDIDHFKLYNDRYGHLVGDQVLTLLTSNIRAHIKTTDYVGRWGGEEFTILLPNTTKNQAALVAERVRQSMNTFIMTKRDQKTVPSPTVSQGIAVFPDEASEIFALIDLADQRLYMAKDRGRNQIEAGQSEWSEVADPRTSGS